MVMVPSEFILIVMEPFTVSPSSTHWLKERESLVILTLPPPGQDWDWLVLVLLSFMSTKPAGLVEFPLDPSPMSDCIKLTLFFCGEAGALALGLPGLAGAPTSTFAPPHPIFPQRLHRTRIIPREKMDPICFVCFI